MTTIYSVQDGDWNTTSTWDTATIPTSSDEVRIQHSVTFAADIYAQKVLLWTTGSLNVDHSAGVWDQITAHVVDWNMHMVAGDSDNRTFNIDGVLLDGCVPRIACQHYSTPLVPTGGEVAQNEAKDVIIDDPGYIGTSATLQDIKPEGCARAYARKVSNNVRYLTVTISVRASMPYYLGRIYQMARSPYQVLLSTDRSVIKGYIETVAPDPGAVGTAYIRVKVTVAEGA